MAKITNPHYLKFIEKGEIGTIDLKQMEELIPTITHRESDAQAQAMVITAYYTGGRPVEYLELQRKKFSRAGAFLQIEMPSSKNGLPRPIMLQLKQRLVKQLWIYVRDMHPEAYVFFHFRASYTVRRINRKGEIVEYKSAGDKLRYYFKKWFKPMFDGSIPPYYLRHNRFSKMSMNGASETEIRLMKGSRTYEAVVPYVHLSSTTSKKLAKINN